ncbi:MAG: ATP synthase F1 subunit gamma [Myxococcaceae bacterium]
MASLRDIRKRIRSVKNTRQITKAMKMVAAARLRKAQDAVVAARPYAQSLDALLANLAARSSGGELAHPLLAERPVKKVEILLLTSDKGLAGGFNANVIRLVSRFLFEQGAQFESVKLSTAGRKGMEYFRRRQVTMGTDHPGLFARLSYLATQPIATRLANDFLSGQVDAVYLAYNEFVTAVTQRPTLVPLLPFRAAETKSAAAAASVEFVYEPSAAAVLEKLVPQALSVKVYRAFLESVASEHGARMNAMENATSNATDLIGALTLTYNRTRQAVITKELMEIVSGAEALK